MRAARPLLALALALLLAPGLSAGARDVAPPMDTSAAERTHFENFKDLVFAHCLSLAYADAPSVAADARASASGFLEWTSFDLENGGEAMSALVARTLARPYASVQGPDTKLSLMKCVDLRHGAELDALARRLVTDPEARERMPGTDR